MSERGCEPVRRTPFELVFVDGGHEAERLPAIAREAESRGIDVAQPERLLLLEGAGELLRALRPADERGTGGTGEYGALVFHGFHFWRAGRPLFQMAAGALRALLSAPSPVGEWRLEAPAGSGYLQLPRHLVWVPGGENGPPEPADGFFWTLAPGVGGAEARLLLALVLGVRPDRPGFGVIAIDAALPPPPVAHWADVQAREDGQDFANVLPGGEIEGLFALTSIAEALRLASLVFRFAATPAGAPGPEERTADGSGESPHALPPTTLSYRRITGATDG